jgi:hypothetical protein
MFFIYLMPSSDKKANVLLSLYICEIEIRDTQGYVLEKSKNISYHYNL